MIPSVILVGALVRQWWIVVAAAVVWPIVVMVWGDVDSVAGAVGAAILGGANAAIGAAIGTAVWRITRGQS
jgi:hypothetical protein